MGSGSGIALDLRSGDGDRMAVRDSSHIGFSASRYVIRPWAPEPKHGQTYDGVKELLWACAIAMAETLVQWDDVQLEMQ